MEKIPEDITLISKSNKEEYYFQLFLFQEGIVSVVLVWQRRYRLSISLEASSLFPNRYRTKQLGTFIQKTDSK